MCSCILALYSRRLRVYLVFYLYVTPNASKVCSSAEWSQRFYISEDISHLLIKVTDKWREESLSVLPKVRKDHTVASDFRSMNTCSLFVS